MTRSGCRQEFSGNRCRLENRWGCSQEHARKIMELPMSTEMQNSNAYIQQSEVPNVETLTKVQMAYLTDANSALHEAGHLAAAISRGIPAIARIGYDGFSSGRMN